MKHLARLMHCSVCLVVFCFPIFAQNIQNPQSAVDNLIRSSLKVDPSTGGMQLQIPLGQYPGRGGATLPVTLNYSSKAWTIKHQSTLPCNGEPVTSYRPEFAKSSASGWTSTLGWFLPQEDVSLETYEGLKGKPAQQGDPNLFRIMRKFVTLPDGSRHEVRKDDALHSLSDSAFGMYYAVDGSRIMYDLATNTTFLPDGSRFGPDSSGSLQYIDRNGNFMKYTSGTWTDTLGRTFGAPIPGTAPATAGDVVYTLPGGLTYTFRWRNLADVLTDPTQPLRFPGDAASANCTLGSAQPGTLFSTLDGNNKILQGQLFNPVVLWQIGLPNNTNYTFTYNVYGELNKIIYTTGGSETFTYGRWEPLGGQLDDGTYSQANRGVVSRVVSDNVNPPQVWTYAPDNFIQGVDPATDVRIVTAPNGTITKTWYYISRGTQIKYGFDDARTGMVREERVYRVVNSTEVMIRRTVNQLVMDGPQPGGFQTATRNARVTKTVEIILDTGGNALASSTELTYDADLNVTSTRQYNFVEISQATAQTGDIGAIPNGTLVRTQETDYLTGDANYRIRNLLSLPTATRVRDGLGNIVAQSSMAYDEAAFPLLTYGPLIGWSDPGVTARGNATSSSRWLNTTGANFTSHAQYDQCGNVRLAWDARDTSLTNPSQIEYSAVYQHAYPTLNTSPDPDGGGLLVALTTSTEYDAATGLVTSSVDANGQQTTYSYNDPLLRLKQVIRAAGDPTAKNQTTYTYNDVARTVTVTSDLNSFQDNVLKSQILYDALGRHVESRTYEDNTNFIATQTHYDTMGRADMITNPFRPLQETPVWTTTVFDALSRVLTVTTPDNSVMSTSYSGNTVTVTDQAGQKRKSVSDALGRLTDVYEDPLGVNYQTTYGYDALDDLTTVTQQTQTRTFGYDSLSRLTSAINPESGTIGYQYDEVNNLTQKTDARGVISIYGYDALNRNTTIDYSDTPSINPDVSRFYDGATKGKGRLWYSYSGGSESTGSNVEKTVFDSYDAAGRPLIMRQLFKLNGVWSAPYQTSRAYNLAGNTTSQIYPSGHQVTYNYDSAGRLADKDTQNLAFTGNLGDGVPRTYSRGISYAPAGQLKQEQFGTSTPIYNKLFYNSRQQLAEILASTTGGDSSWNRGKIINDYSLQCAGALCNATDNNGNLRKQETYIPANDQVSSSTSWYQQYDYDSLNRLKRVHEYIGNSQLDFQQEYDYDRWGNRTLNATNTWIGNSANPPNPALNETAFDTGSLATNNRLYAPGDLALPDNQRRMRYDAAGNLIGDSYTGAGDRVYDAENRMTQAWANSQWQYYTYNADGQRTRRKVNAQETWQVYGFDGALLAEYPANGAASQPNKEYGYRNGQLLITAEAGLASAPAAFADDFNDNSLNANSWSVDFPGSSPTVSEQSQQLQITLSPNTAAYNGVYSNATYDLTNRMVQVESVQAVSQAGWCENYLEVELNANNYFMIQVGAGNMIFRSRVNGVNDQTSIAFDGVANRFWRIRHDQSTNQIYFETSANDSVWLTRKSVTAGFSLTSLRFHLLAGAYGAGNASPGAAKYDNFKLLASSAGSVSLTVPNAGFESPVLGNGNFQYSPSGGSWSFANGSGISGMNSPFTGVPSAAPEGVQVAFIQGSGTVSQSISGFQAGVDYVITFSAIQRTNCCNTGGQDIGVYLDSTLVGTFHPGNSGYVEYSTAPFNTTAGSHTVKFVGLNPLGGDHTAFIDNIRINGSPKLGFGIQWLLTDQLGTPRMVFDASGALANVKRHDYLPFGEEVSTLGLRAPSLGYSASDGVRQQFTLYERDVETELDYAVNRYYSASQGRFSSPDPYIIVVEKEKGRDDKERSQILLNYCLQPQIWNKYTYSLNNPFRYVDPDGRRPRTELDLARIKRLTGEYEKAKKAGDADLANAISQAINEIGAAIDAVPEGQEDPSNLKTVFFAIDQLGAKSFATNESNRFSMNGWEVALGPGDNKCNFFVAMSWALGGGIGLNGNGNTKGVPVYGTKGGVGGLWGNGYVPGANEWSGGRVQNFTRVTAPQLGDVAAWGSKGQGHSGIYVGGGAVIYAHIFEGVKIQSVQFVNSKQNTQAAFNRYKP